jgi:hypothetical protein
MTRKPAVGTLHTSAFEQLASAPGAAGIPYVYNLDVAGPAGIIPAQRYRVQPSSLAAVTDRYYQDVPSTGDWATFGGFPDEGFMAIALGGLTLPGVLLQYFSTAPDLLWSRFYDAFGFLSGAQQDDAFYVLSPGRLVVDWNRYPLHPQPDVSAAGPGGRLFPLIPSAIRSGNTLTLTTRPFSDNQLGHLGTGFGAAGTTITGSYEIDQNGTRISRGSTVNGIPAVMLARNPSVIRFTLDAARTGPSYLLSTSSRTVWTWRSRRQPAATVPPSWHCAHALRRCAVQPMMTLDYEVQGLALNGSAPAGSQLVPENGQAQAYAASYHHPGHVIVVSSGDVGFTSASFPANLATVTAAGGPQLARARNARGWSEQVWYTSHAGASGSGCSAYVAKPSWQHDPHCGMRTAADVSALAWNASVYEKIQGGWLTVGGTSVSAPLIAGVYGLAGNAGTVKPGAEYQHAGSLFDITTGNNDWLNATSGATCGSDYLCTAKKGYDAPTGMGTPDGIGRLLNHPRLRVPDRPMDCTASGPGPY